jgi:acyl transferase domain-containing protein/surfactin synthase thioesterase subunit/acyl carrier protein
MDPQQRLFLEVCWEACENAGYDPTACPGTVGVLSAGGGVVSSYLLAKLHDQNFPGQTASIAHINNDKDFLSTRVAFKLNLRGPSFTIQSACSSSLVAVHQACQTLRYNECDMMLVGGSVVRVPQRVGYLAEKRNLHSLDGHCRPFDAVGQGTIFGSGVGAVLLKPLDQAVADRDHIYAVIKGTAANNDGSSKTSYTAPSLGQQSQAVAEALELAGVLPDDVGYLECHSTGTIVGDPLEIEALTLAFRKLTARKQFCAIGSVKANIGHPEQAAGIAGLIKTALVLHHKQIPPSINYDTPNPSIDFESSPFYVNTSLTPFVSADAARRAGLNSLGIGGTNVFAVLEEAPAIAVGHESSDARPCLVTLSAKSADALIDRVEQLLNWLNDNPDARIGDLCFTTNLSRSQFPFRFAAPARSTSMLKDHLAQWLRSARDEASKPKPTEQAPIAFMFSGQGSQYAGMAAQLYRTHPVFRDAINRCNALAQFHLEHDLLDVVFAQGVDADLVNRTDYTQPALLAVEYALAQLLTSWGIVPNALIGHSLGEIAAACRANVISIDDAMRLAIARGALMHRLPGGGAMIAIMAPDNVVKPLVEDITPEVSIAAMNGPLNTVVSGDRDVLKRLGDELDRRGITHRELRISNGFHSPRTEPILDELERVAAHICHNPPELPLISNLTGEVMSAAPDKSYWRRHIREGVRFGDGMQALAALASGSYLEIGSHPVLLPMAQACLQSLGKSGNWIATLNRNESDADSLTAMLVALYLAGHKVNWAGVHAGAQWRRIALPTYPFQRQRHWIDDTLNRNSEQSPKHNADELHPLLGRPVDSTAAGIRFEVRYGVQHISYLSDHKVAGTVVLPTTVELEAAMSLGRRYFGSAHVAVVEAMHHEAMSFVDGEERVVRLSASALSGGRASFTVASATTGTSGDWHTHMTGTLRKSEASYGSTFLASEVRARCPKAWPVADLYDRLASDGLEYGPRFRAIHKLYVGRNETLTEVQLPKASSDPRCILHPAFLDACLHVYPIVIDTDANSSCDSGARSAVLPVSLQEYRCYQDGIDHAWVHTKLRSVENHGTQLIDIRICDEAGRAVAELQGLAVRRLPLDKVRALPPGEEPSFYQVAWRKSERRQEHFERYGAPTSWLIFADSNGVGAALATRMEAVGHRCHLVYRGDALTRQGLRTWTANERKPQDFRTLMEQFSATEPLVCEGVVYAWGLDACPVADLNLAKLRNSSEMMCRGALAILHALADVRSNTAARSHLWLLTANCQSIGQSQQDIDPVQAPLWGLGRTIALEYPAIWGGLIDLRWNSREPDIEALINELLRPDGETQIAISEQGDRNVARLVSRSLADFPEQLPHVRPDAAYLVAGGLGMLGRSIAKWLIEKGAKHVVVTGRHATTQQAEDLTNLSNLNGAAIYVVVCDVSREDDVARLVEWISNELPPLSGVVHSAGVLDDGILAQLDWNRFANLFEPRVLGSWLLHKYTASFALDFFVLNSSLLSLLGSAGQANYTASCAFIDSLVAHRRASGQQATAVNWCAWSGGGLATVSGSRGEAMWSSLGHRFISPDAAMQAFDKLMRSEVDQIAIAAADWPTYATKVGNPLFLSELLGSVDSRRAAAHAVVSDTPQAAHGWSRQQVLIRLQQHITTKLGFAEPVAPDQRLNDIGVDSLMSVTLSNGLESEFGIPVPVADIISGPTINELVDGVFSDLFKTRPSEHFPPLGSVHPAAFVSGGTQPAVGTLTNETPFVPKAPLDGGGTSAKTSLRPGASDLFNGGSHTTNGAISSNKLNRTELHDHLQRRIMEELGFSSPLDPDQKLNEVGLDSLRSVAMSNRLESDFGIPVAVSELISGPSINELTDYLVGEFARLQQDQGIRVQPPIRETLSDAISAHTSTIIEANPPSIVFEVSGTSGAKGLDIRLGADASSVGLELRNVVAGHAAQIQGDANGVAYPGRYVATNPATNGHAGASHALGNQPGHADKIAPRTSGKWLIAPRPNPDASVRLFCFPYAGGGVASFRAWPQLAHEALEIIAVEPPGRGTRINEAAVEDLDTFVERLLPELIGWLDRPSAFFGHCLGGLTMFATLCALPETCAHFVKHSFACGVRPPHLLRRKGRFEDELAYKMMLHPKFDIRVPPYAQNDDLFAEIVSRFDTPAADRMLAIPKLRRLLLPAIRSEFGMAYNYRYQSVKPFRFPITSFVGLSDPWVSERDSAGWGDLTRGTFTNHVRRGSHFLMVDDQDFIMQTINKDFVDAVLQ